MTLIEMVIYVGWPACLAFCFVFPVHGAFRLAFLIGVGTGFGSFLGALVVGGLFQLVPKWRSVAFFPVWSVIALTSAAVAGFCFARSSHLSLLGIPAFVAALVAASGPERWRRAGIICFAAALVLAIVLRVFATDARLSMRSSEPPSAGAAGGRSP
jgi:hypothetical protein